MERIFLPEQLGNRIESYNQVISIQRKCLYGKSNKIIIDFKNCKTIFPNLVPIIASLPELASTFNKDVKLDLTNIMDYNFKVYMVSSGLSEYFDHNFRILVTNPNVIKLKKFNLSDLENTETIIDYIVQVFNLPHVKLSEKVRELLICKLYEIFANAFEHSYSKIGVFCCGQYLPEKNRLYFSIYDAGVGIPYNVRKYLKNDEMSSTDTLKWAFKSGNSTVYQSEYPRGIGLDFLKKFIQLNNGKISIFSDDSVCYMQPDKETYLSRPNRIYGTSFNINIADDTKHIYTIKNKNENS